MTEVADQVARQSVIFPRRDNLLAELTSAVDTAVSTGGGVVALVGRPGFGKSVLARQFVGENHHAMYVDGFSGTGSLPVTPQLSGIAFLDEVWQFDAVDEAIQRHCRDRGVVVAMACFEYEVAARWARLMKAVVHVPHWNYQPQACMEVETPRTATSSRIVRFRGPSGQTWTGFGRAPNWLLALEADGKSREQYRVDNTPLTQRRTYRS